MQTANHHDNEPGAELIHRRRPNDHFLMIPNGTVRDRSVSYLARGLLAEILSHQAGWRVTADEMAAGSPGAGRRAVHAAFRELRSAGYLHRVVIRGTDGKLRTQLHAFSEPARCGTSGCQDCRQQSQLPAPPDVSAGSTDIPLTDSRSAVGHIEDGSTEDIDRRRIVGPRSAPTAPDPEIQRQQDLEAVTAAARDHLGVIIESGGREASYLLRTLTRSGKRPVANVGNYARMAFIRDRAEWRTLAVLASDNDGHVPDWQADEILAQDGPRARGDDYFADSGTEYLDLRSSAEDAA
jgi:hypothetical protein